MNGEKVLLVKPQTFMNESGKSVRALVDFYKLSPHDIIVMHDDKDIPLGEYRIHKNRGAAGHNGVISIVNHLGTKDFTRIRIGVGPKEKGIEKIVDYVLERFSTTEFVDLQKILTTIATEIPHLLTELAS
jgi:PTH1 family peptidyl-tRNA hydrolase